MPTSYISFSAEINQQTTEALLGCVFDQVTRGAEDIYLLFSSPGGFVDQGMTIYNVLRGLPVPLTIHNVGAVNSIANVIFLSGTTRRACRHSTFMFHGVGFDVTSPIRLEEKFLRERLAGIAADQAKIAGVMQDRTQLTTAEISELFLEARTKDADYALAKGIVGEIAEIGLPAGTPVIQLIFKR
jgi:ATP-dependent protease ClpP protease subunit